MKKSVFIVAVILIICTLFACTAYEDKIIGSWKTKGSILGLDEQMQEYDIYLTFENDSSGKLTHKYTDNEIEEHTFKYKTENDYLIVLSYDGEELDTENHKYIFSVENNTLTFKVKNQNIKYERKE